MLVAAHWRKTPAEIEEISESDLEFMEYSYTLLERRQAETQESVIGPMLGATWDVADVLGGEGQRADDTSFTWSLRTRRPKIHLPVTAALTQNPKFFEMLKASAAKERLKGRQDASVLNKPLWVKKDEYVDLSNSPKEEFLRMATRI